MHMRNNFPNTTNTPSKINTPDNLQDSNTITTSFSHQPSNLTPDSSLLETCEFTPFLFQKSKQDLNSLLTQSSLTSPPPIVRRPLTHPPPIPCLSQQLHKIKTIELLTPLQSNVQVIQSNVHVIESNVHVIQNVAPPHVPPPPIISLAPLPNYLKKTLKTVRFVTGTKVNRTHLRLANFHFDSDSSPSPPRVIPMFPTVSNINEVNPMLRQRRGPSQYNIASFLDTDV
jgi:hypothetical protein